MHSLCKRLGLPKIVAEILGKKEKQRSDFVVFDSKTALCEVWIKVGLPKIVAEIFGKKEKQRSDFVVL